MTENTDIEDVESAEDYKERFGSCASDDCRSEGTVLEEIEADFESLKADVEDMDPLPTEEEAELGELCRVEDPLPSPKGATDEEVRAAIEDSENDEGPIEEFEGWLDSKLGSEGGERR
jgi:hypothetical protein